MRSLGAPAEEVNYILAEKRMELLSGKELEKFEEETVLAQLGVEKPDDEEGDEEDAAAAVEETPSEVVVEAAYDAAANVDKKVDTVEDALVKDDGDVQPPKQADAEMKPLLKEVIKANTSKRDKDAEKEEEGEAALKEEEVMEPQ